MEYYQEILAFHIISVLSWMAMLFYMPRLFVYHMENIEKKEFVEVVKIQEDKIYRVIGFPAMIATIISGGALIYFNPSLLEQDWMIAKLLTLILMIIYSFSLESYRKILANNQSKRSKRFSFLYKATEPSITSNRR
jgi:putative membrane protein